MARRNRNTLKGFFRPGALPSADHFSDLIESTVNQIDDGFDKHREQGLKISSIGTGDLVSFFRECSFQESESRSTPCLWSIGYAEKSDKLLFTKLDQEQHPRTVLSLAPDGRVGIDNITDPECSLDVGGAIRSQGRIGAIPDTPKCEDRKPGELVRADGIWHDITDTLAGCHALEVMAGVGRKNSGRYALMHAIAMNAHNPTGLFSKILKLKSRIKCQHAYYSSRRDKLQLRWEGGDQGYRLQIRSRCDYEKGSGSNGVKKDVFIRYYVTKLWFDAEMQGSAEATVKVFPDAKTKGSSDTEVKESSPVAGDGRTARATNV